MVRHKKLTVKDIERLENTTVVAPVVDDAAGTLDGFVASCWCTDCCCTDECCYTCHNSDRAVA